MCLQEETGEDLLCIIANPCPFVKLKFLSSKITSEDPNVVAPIEAPLPAQSCRTGYTEDRFRIPTKEWTLIIYSLHQEIRDWII